MTQWIKTWEYIEDDIMYLLCPIAPKSYNRTLCYTNCQILKGWRVKQHVEGCYLATPFRPPLTLDECK